MNKVKKKILKKKRLKKINKDFIQKNPIWIPPLQNNKWSTKTNSWFDITQTSIKPLVEGKNKFPITKEIRCKTVRIYPNVNQRKKLLEWLEIYRLIYNITVDYFRTNAILSFFTARPIIQQKIRENKYLDGLISNYKIQQHICDNAINDYIKAFKSTLANKNAGNIIHFRMRHKKKSHHLRTLVLEPTMFSKTINGFCKKDFGKMKSSEYLTGIKKECRLSYNARTGIFVIRVSYDKTTYEVCHRNNCISLDPGLRTFQTGYSSDGIGYKFGTTATSNKIKSILNRIKNVVKLKNHTKFVARLRQKVTNMVTDMQWKLAKFLCQKFDKILLGNMSTTGIVKKEKSFLSSADKIFCIAQSHYTFRERLKSKAAEYSVYFKVVDESYTSKTCGGCGEIDENLGGKKIFTCPKESCNFKIDRDYNGGRNILLKYCSIQ